MASLQELKDALRDTLAARGTLGQIQARVRAEIFNALEEAEEKKPALSQENLIINELIREYLEYNHYKHTLSVLIPETGQPPDRMDRFYMAQELGIREDYNSRQVPLLYGILAKLQRERMPPAHLQLQSSASAGTDGAANLLLPDPRSAMARGPAMQPSAGIASAAGGGATQPPQPTTASLPSAADLQSSRGGPYASPHFAAAASQPFHNFPPYASGGAAAARAAAMSSPPAHGRPQLTTTPTQDPAAWRAGPFHSGPTAMGPAAAAAPPDRLATGAAALSSTAAVTLSGGGGGGGGGGGRDIRSSMDPDPIVM